MSATTTVIQSRDFPAQARPDHFEDNVAEKRAIERLSHGVTIAGVPSFTSYELKRHWMLEHMAGAFRVFARKGFAEGLAGHISLRDPEHLDCFWTNPARRATKVWRTLWLIKVSDLILLNEKGVPVGGATNLPANAAGFEIHSHLHKSYPHVNAACHTHSKYGKTYSTFGRRLEMINQDACDFYGDAHAVYPDFGGVVLSDKEGAKLSKCLGPKGKVLILQNNGLLTVGQTVDEAAYLYTLMERSCEVQLLVDAAADGSGKAKKFASDEAAKFTFKAVSDPEALYCAFQPDFAMEKALSNGDLLK